ncbi:Hypothetical predicted protein [Paramuricea clavata]|uniref:Uncharacterized protein n=1 Tax=Paramuricea clavata TaxID=317549 RepID=A0A7D9E7T3_PARCT|nr:Hypothetical predicted protein [Paramuricea clavata]
MEEHQEEYDDQKMEELKEKYPNYEEMDIETLDSELPYLDKDLRESETTEETQDINEEINYIQELRRRKMLSGDLTREQLAEKFPDLSNLSYDDLMDRGDRLLNELILSGLDEEDFREKSEELRYVRMLSNDYQRESNLNKLLNLRLENMWKVGDTTGKLVYKYEYHRKRTTAWLQEEPHDIYKDQDPKVT